MPHGINTDGDNAEGTLLFALGGSGKLAAKLAMLMLCARDRATGKGGRGR
jgi:hypothetical protein